MKRKGTLCKTLVIQSIRVLLACAILIILIIYRKHFGLNNIKDYINCLLDCYSIFEIYSAVGYFLVQSYNDCCKLYNKRLIRRYYRYSLIKIIEKTKEYWKNIKQSYKIMKENAPIFQNSDSLYHKFLQTKLNDIQKEINNLIGEGNSININNIDNDDSEAGINQNNTYQNLNLEKNLTGNPIVNPTKNIDKFSTQKIEQNKNKKLNDYLISTKIRKFKESKRRINKLKKLSRTITQESKKDFKEAKIYQQEQIEKGKKIEEDEKTKNGESETTIEEESNNNKSNSQNQKEDISCREVCGGCCVMILLCYAIFFILINDFLLPLIFKYGMEEGDMIIKFDKSDKEKNVFELIASIFLLCPVLAALCSSYTFIMIYTHTKRSYITGDFLYDEKINDSLNLLKSVQIICGYSFAIVYCNLNYYKALDKFGELGKPIYYENTFIPDYKISGGLTVFFIVKLAIIIFSIIACLKLDDVTVFENDLAEFYLCKNGCKYDSNNELEKVREENSEVMKILKSDIEDEKK